ncbi:hypothetical protein [Novosphingobium resinovorum]|uniref:hypothetical protein n=1 Tax=Novosphingobium resinovorum TaxID=158500 RepID=UPI002ED4EC71|nr:hypothetical protein [Novosphingobium resinovorum]
MSLIAATVTLAAATLAAAAPLPVHSVDLEHRSNAYKVDYRARVTTSTRTIGISPPARQSTQRCIMTATVTVERVIADGSHQLVAALPRQETFTRQLPGDCRSRKGQLADLVEDKRSAIGAHLAATAAEDRPQALAAIDAAHHFAAN